MNRQRILGFFDDLARSPAFLFLCAVFLCGAVAGGLTGLRAAEGDGAVELAAMLDALPAQAIKSVLCALLWVMLAPLCALLRPAPLFLSAAAAARGFVLALTLAVGLGQPNGMLLTFGAAALPAALSVPALLAACAMVWQSGEAAGRYSLRVCRVPFVICLLLAAAGALLRVAFAALWQA